MFLLRFRFFLTMKEKEERKTKLVIREIVQKYSNDGKDVRRGPKERPEHPGFAHNNVM